MKSENEPEISLTVYFKSVKKKGKYVLRKKQTKQNQKKKGPKKKLLRPESNPGLPIQCITYRATTASKERPLYIFSP